MFSLSLNAKSVFLAKTLATAGLLATVVQTLPAQAATLDWGTLKSSTPFAGTISQSNTISVSGGGSVNLELGTIADINNVNLTRTLGTGSQFASGPNNAPTPSIDPLLNGTLPDASPSLYLQQDSGAVANAVYAGFKFNNPGGVSGLTFTLFDIDNSSNSLTSNSWQDRVIVRGLFNGVAVLPTTVSAVSTFLNASTGNISVDGVGTGYAGANISGATVLDGTKSVNNDSSNSGNVTISFAGPVDQLYIDFTQAPGATGSNPTSHGIGIGNMTYQAVPEPLTLLGAATAIAFGTAFKRRSAQLKNRD
jgi:hypothetical protein